MEEESIRIHLPIAISYPALEGVLRKKMVGEFVPKPEEGEETAPYAQILDVGISGSSAGASEVILRVKIRILRTVMKRDQVDLYVLARLGYDNASQELYVEHFNLNSRTSSGFYNTALEVMVNKVAYNQIIRKARINVNDIVEKELLKANNLLNEGMEVKGVRLMGAVSEVRVQDITPQPSKVTLSVEVKGNMEANVLDLSELL
ncbi:DUF4403 family protein [Pontibacter sp. H249]|uniref:DUF4403 family protein n=1 Tax=Pontibacter sp. H249 TaxID=3133420 RepID=UPI0030C17CB9